MPETRDTKLVNDVAKIMNSLEQVQEDIKTLRTDFNVVKESMSNVNATNESIQKDTKKIYDKLNAIDQSLYDKDKKYNELLRTVNSLNERLNKLESYSRRDNLLFNGIQEAPSGTKESVDDCAWKVREVLENHLGIENAKQMRFVRCHRVGTPPSTRAGPGSPGRPRAIICKFHWYGDRQLVWQSKNKLKGTKIIIQEDFPKEILDRRKLLLPIMYAARKQNLTSYLAVDKLHVITRTDNGEKHQVYDVGNLKSLPKSLDPRWVTTERKDNVLAFSGPCVLYPISIIRHF
jgi:uncharacterized protein YoxC